MLSPAGRRERGDGLAQVGLQALALGVLAMLAAGLVTLLVGIAVLPGVQLHLEPLLPSSPLLQAGFALPAGPALPEPAAPARPVEAPAAALPELPAGRVDARVAGAPTAAPPVTGVPAAATAPASPGAGWPVGPSAALSAVPSATRVASLTPIPLERWFSIGQSVEGRPLEVFRFGQGRRQRMIVAGTHGADEYNTVALADELVLHLTKNPQLVPADMSLYILRALNPDSAVLGAKEGKRLNANGVDLNRNFPVNWKRSWRSTGCSSLPGTAGEQPASEPETQALMAFLQQRPIELLVSYHSAFLGVAPSGDPPHAASVRLAQGIAGITRYPYPPLYTGCEYTGTLVDFAASTGVFAAVDLELNSVYGTELKTNLKVLDLLLTWQLPAR